MYSYTHISYVLIYIHIFPLSMQVPLMNKFLYCLTEFTYSFAIKRYFAFLSNTFAFPKTKKNVKEVPNSPSNIKFQNQWRKKPFSQYSCLLHLWFGAWNVPAIFSAKLASTCLQLVRYFEQYTNIKRTSVMKEHTYRSVYTASIKI